MPATGGSKQERKRYMRNGWWSIVVGGVVGVLLWAGPVVAQPFPDGLRACVRELKTCKPTCIPVKRTWRRARRIRTHFFGDELDGPTAGRPRYRNNGNGTFTDNNTRAHVGDERWQCHHLAASTRVD